VFLLSALGYLFGKHKQIHLPSLNEFVIYIATPCLILSSLSKKHIEISDTGYVFATLAIMMLLSSAVTLIILRKLKLDKGTYLPPVLFANTGNMGLPIIYYAFGQDGLSLAILYMVCTTFLHYTVGILLFNIKNGPLELLKLPLIYSAIIGLAISFLNIELPVILSRTLQLAGEASIPTMLFALGYKLSEITISHLRRSVLFGCLRIGLGFIFSIVAIKLLNIKGLLASVIILQASMPPAIFNFVLAEKYRQNSQAVASIIMAGTIISVFTLPLILNYLLR